jgi:hypothetical protein
MPMQVVIVLAPPVVHGNIGKRWMPGILLKEDTLQRGIHKITYFLNAEHAIGCMTTMTIK